MPMELTPLRVERDRSNFEGWYPFKRFLPYQGGAAPSAGRWAANSDRFLSFNVFRYPIPTQTI
jgi:hypothetical protein